MSFGHMEYHLPTALAPITKRNRVLAISILDEWEYVFIVNKVKVCWIYADDVFCLFDLVEGRFGGMNKKDVEQ